MLARQRAGRSDFTESAGAVVQVIALPGVGPGSRQQVSQAAGIGFQPGVKKMEHWARTGIKLEKVRLHGGEIIESHGVQRRCRRLGQLRQLQVVERRIVQRVLSADGVGGHGMPHFVHQPGLELQRAPAARLVSLFQQVQKRLIRSRERHLAQGNFVEQPQQFGADVPQIGMAKPVLVAQSPIDHGLAAADGQARTPRIQLLRETFQGSEARQEQGIHPSRFPQYAAKFTGCVKIGQQHRHTAQVGQASALQGNDFACGGAEQRVHSGSGKRDAVHFSMN
jgi:hypothetical protein